MKMRIAGGEAPVVGGLLAVQCGMGAYIVFSGKLLAGGFSPVFLIFVVCVAAAVVGLPIAVVLERRRWPARLTAGLCAQLFAVGLGTLLFQELLSLGLERTAPAVTAAMLSLIPAVVFLIAVCLRLEKVELRCKYSWAKLLGTAFCVAGVIVLSVLQSSSHGASTSTRSYADWAIGCLLLLAGILSISSGNILQAIALQSFPAPLTMCVICWIISALACPVAQLIFEGRFGVGPTGPVTGTDIALAAALGGAFQTMYYWMIVYSMSKQGPVFVAMFSPVSTVSSAAIGAVLLPQATVGIGSLIGTLLMFSGLYIFLWGKLNEQKSCPSSSSSPSHDQQETERGEGEGSESKNDLEKPMLLH